jgi:cardiolipin synthase
MFKLHITKTRLLCAVGWLVLAASHATLSATETSPGQSDAASLATLLSTGPLTRGFVKDGHVQVYLADQGQDVMLKASWKEPRVKADEFSFASATLEANHKPPRPPSASSGWREIRVLDRVQSEHLLKASVERLVPKQAGHGIYCRYAFGAAVLFRNAAGTMQIRPGEQDREGLQIDRRYSRQELASGVAAAIEEDLRAQFPNDRDVMLSLGNTNRWRLALIDLSQRQTAVFYPPRPSNDPRPSARLGLRISNLASFILIDNAWSFLKNPISSTTRTLNQLHQWTATLFESRLRNKSSKVPPPAQGPGMDLVSWERWLDQHTHSVQEPGSLRLLIDGDHFFPLLENRIAEAQSQVDIHVCIFDRDDVAVEVAELLKKRSTKVPVRVIYDRLNSRGAGKAAPSTPMPAGFSEPRSIDAELRSGGQVNVRPQLNPGFTCDHSKVFLIDSRYAYLGGMNIGREYRYEWHDMMAEVEGPVVASLQRQFDKKWAQVGWWGDCGLAAESVCASKGAPPNLNSAELIEMRRLYTKTFDRQIRRAELAAIARASNHVYLENAYLYNNDMIVALVRARSHGVDVRVIMPSDNDFGAGHKSNLVTANYLLERGVRVYFYPGMSHIKALDADGWICFGSANFDALSLRLNREADLATSDPRIADLFRRELFEPDFQKSSELSESVETSFGDHLADAVLNPF